MPFEVHGVRFQLIARGVVSPEAYAEARRAVREQLLTLEADKIRVLHNAAGFVQRSKELSDIADLVTSRPPGVSFVVFALP